MSLDHSHGLASCFGSNVRRDLGNGGAVDFWNDHWVGSAPIASSCPNLYAGCVNKHFSVMEIGSWIGYSWHRKFLWLHLSDPACVEEAATLHNILMEVKPDRMSVTPISTW